MADTKDQTPADAAAAPATKKSSKGKFIIILGILVLLLGGGGAAAFFAPAKKRSASKLTAEVCQHAQGLLEQGLTVPEVGRQLGILPNTLHKAIRSGRLRAAKKKIHPMML